MINHNKSTLRKMLDRYHWTERYLILSGRAVDRICEEASKDTEKSSLIEQSDNVVIKCNTMQ